MTKIALSDLPDWPRLMTRAVAAAYMGVSVDVFIRRYEPSIRPRELKPFRYDRRDLDNFIDGPSRKSTQEALLLRQIRMS
jgi:hypothetical protein